MPQSDLNMMDISCLRVVFFGAVYGEFPYCDE